MSRAPLTFVRATVTWRFWAFGWHRGSTSSGKFMIFTIGFGPLRFQFLEWGPATRSRLQELSRSLSVPTAQRDYRHKIGGTPS